MKTISLGNGKEVIVDDEDYKYLSRFHWTLMSKENRLYAVRNFFIENKNIHIPMWKFVIPSENNKGVLYLNKNSLDNRKENLRLVPMYVANHKSEKKARGKHGKPTSKYKGVSYSQTYMGHKKWVADIVFNGTRFSKHFLTEKEAGEYYNEKAKELYGDYAYQNIISND